MVLDLLSGFDSYNLTDLSSFPLRLSFYFVLVLISTLFYCFVPLCGGVFTKSLVISWGMFKSASGLNLSGFPVIVSSIFFFLMAVNAMGLVPFSFSVTSHLSLGPALAFLMWGSLWLSGHRISAKQNSTSLVPSFAPMFLVPFLLLVEIVTISSRPVTLGFRLMINIIAGHLILSMGTNVNAFICLKGLSLNLGGPFYGVMYFSFFAWMGLLAAELAVGLIQAFIFCSLLSLYTSDHSN
uniref:ATP synthase subunit a n=1 Tax=Bathymodiolus aduloides TaxID=268473 RepID=A0A8A2F7B3_9BIVA|nr:ATP synthase F0 subunit 6 [Bathymodiolus aduloides]QSV10326.1 ATP synthase F0 subunit 6 [Bathymodiolus aduloides]